MKKHCLAVLVLMGVFMLLGTPGFAAMAEKPDFTWRFQMVHNPGQPEYELYAKACEDIFVTSGGRLKIVPYAGGSLASSLEAFQACGEGAFEMNTSWPVYMKGLEYGFVAAGDGEPMSLSWEDKIVWMYEGGGWNQMQKAFDKVNLHMISFGIQTANVMVANSPFFSFAEMAGKKFRTSQGEVKEFSGVVPVSLPLEEVFTAFTGGTVDMAEFGTLYYNVGLGINDAAKYGIYPDFWNVSNVECTVVNKNAWDKLPEDLKTLVNNTFRAYAIRTTTILEYRSAQTMKKYYDEGSMKFIRLPAEDMSKARQKMREIQVKYAKEKGELTRETYELLDKFYALFFPYREVSSWWGTGLTPSKAAGFEIESYLEKK
jgi:TRAP-type mannitol/chloroaromatic compound transport system substrate-binding protein